MPRMTKYEFDEAVQRAEQRGLERGFAQGRDAAKDEMEARHYQIKMDLMGEIVRAAKVIPYYLTEALKVMERTGRR